MNGEQAAFKPASQTPLQKIALRFVVIGLIYYGFAAIEGMLMRTVLVDPGIMPVEQYFGILTAHPLVGIFGSTYSIVFGAFLFLVPFLMKKPIWSVKMANWSFLLVAIGTITFWTAGFITHYAPLYTLYWPLPADFDQFTPVGGAFFILGIALVMVGTVLYVINIFKTIVYTPEGWEKQPSGALIRSALGITGLTNLFRKKKDEKEHLVSLPVAAIARGTVDVALNSGIILFTGVLILVYMVAAIFGHSLEKTAIDALLYKNWFWWGLDLVADGLVLIYVAGSWYLLATLITGQKLFMENVARAALMLELIVSWMVWSHHLLADQGQPEMMKLISGEMVTAFELLTQGLALFITLVTLWKARPLKMTPALAYLLGGLVGFGLAVPAAIIQADMGMNRVLHNTQWIIMAHVHIALIVGLYMTLYSALYVLWPIVTNNTTLYSKKLTWIHYWLYLIGGVAMGAFGGMAGLDGMLRRHLYINGEYNTWMILAAIAGSMVLIAWFLFLMNIVLSVGIKGLIGIFQPAKDPTASYGIEPETVAEEHKG